MKTKVTLTILNLVLVILVGLLLSKLLSKPKDTDGKQTVTDTVFIDRPLKPEPGYKDTIGPEVIYNYIIDTVPVADIKVLHDTVFIKLQDSGSLQVSTQFLTQFPTTDRLIQLLLDEDVLRMSLQNTSGSVYTKEYQISLDKFSYNYVGNSMTTKKKSFFKKFSPYTELQYRPFHTMVDLNLGIKYNTNTFKYEFGVNTFYYPTILDKVGFDVFFKINYTF